MKSLSVIIPTRNRRDQILKTARAILDDPAVTQLVVADDGSDDGTTEALEQAFGSDGRLKCINAGGKGKPNAGQMALTEATGDIILYMDDDVLAGPGLATGHLRHHEQRDGLIVIGYMPIVDIPSGPGMAATKIYQKDYERICRSWEEDPSTILHNLWGGNISLSRADANRIGLKSTDYHPLGRHEDRDFGLRCLKAGLTGVFDRSLSSVHLYQRSLNSMIIESRWQAIGMVQAHTLHSDVIGVFDPQSLADTATWQRNWVVRLGMTSLGHPPIAFALTLGSKMAGRFGRYEAEVALTRLLRKCEQGFYAQKEMKRLTA